MNRERTGSSQIGFSVREQIKELENYLPEIGMEQKASTRLSCRAQLVLFSDGELNFDLQEIDRAFHSGPDVIDIPTRRRWNPRYKRDLLRIIEQVAGGGFSNLRILMAIASKPNMGLICGRNRLPRFVEIPPGKQFKDVCDKQGYTISLVPLDSDDPKQILPCKFCTMFISAGSVNDSSIYFPEDNHKKGGFNLTATQSVASTIGHEAVHVFFRAFGVPKDERREEAFVQFLERESLLYYEQHPLERPIPVRY